MPTFEQFYNQTLPVIINVINAQSNEIIIQRYAILGLIGTWVLIILAIFFKRFIKVERRKKIKKKES